MVRRKNKWKLIMKGKGSYMWAMKIKNGFKTIEIERPPILSKRIWFIIPSKYDGKKWYNYDVYEAKTYKEALRIKNKLQRKFPKPTSTQEPPQTYVEIILDMLK